MHPTVLAIAGYTLLLSSFLTLIIVLRSGIKRRTRNEFYILSTSDILNSIFIAIMLLVNHANMVATNYYNKNDGNNNIKDSTNFKEYDLHHQNNIFKTLLGTYNKSMENEDMIGTDCNIINVLLYHAMMFLPLTNAFISLLIFALLCNSHVKNIDVKCGKLLKEEMCIQRKRKRSDEINSVEVEFVRKNGDNESLKDDDLQIKEGARIISESTFPLESAKNLGIPRNGSKKTEIMYVLNQWLIPIIVTSILAFADHNSKQSTVAGNIDCMYLSNFPFDECYTTRDPTESFHVYSTMEPINFESGYIANEFPNNASDTSNIDINNIVSNVYTIVQSVLNYTHDISNISMLTTDYNTSDFLTETESAEIQNTEVTLTSDIELSETNTSLSEQALVHKLENDSTLWVQNVEDAGNYSNMKITMDNNLTENNQHMSAILEEDTENKVFLFEPGDVIVQPTSTTSPLRRNNYTTQVTNDNHGNIIKNNYISKEEIYADIIKRIQSVNKESKIKKKHQHLIRKHPKQYNIEEQDGYVFEKQTDENRDNITQYIQTSTCMLHKCFISTSFLKIFLLMLAVTNVLIPIVFTSILQERGKILCQSIFERTEANIVFICADKLSLPATEGRETSPGVSNLEKEEKFGSTSREKINFGSGDSNVQNMDTSQKDDGTSAANLQDTIFSKEQICNNILKDADNMKKIIQTTRVSLIFCVSLWTPMFLEMLLKVYSCLYIPTWIINTSFLGAISFGIIRNIINLNIINIQATNKVGNKKVNSIYPDL